VKGWHGFPAGLQLTHEPENNNQQKTKNKKKHIHPHSFG
jgi:hypothetical protein